MVFKLSFRTVAVPTVVFLAMVLRGQMNHFDNRRNVVQFVQKEVEAGLARGWQGDFYSSEMFAQHYLLNAVASGLTLLGYYYTSFSAKTTRVLDLYSWFEPSDAEGRFCRQMIEYRWLHPFQGGWVYPEVRANHADILQYIEACRKELKLLPPDVREVIEPWRVHGGIPEPIITREHYDFKELGRQARQEPIPEYPCEKMGQEELEAIIKESMQGSFWNGVVDKIPDRMIQYWMSLDVRRTPWIAADWKVIGEHIRKSEIALFDATRLFPKAWFNSTMQELASREGEAAKRIAVLYNMCLPDSFHHYAEMVNQFVQKQATTGTTLADPYTITKESLQTGDVTDQQMQALSFLNTVEESKRAAIGMAWCNVAYVNNRRLPNFYKEANVPGMIKGMGMEDEILRDEGYLWLGSIRGGFHYDEETNIYVQLSGYTDLILIPASHVDVFTNGERHKDMPTMAEILNDPYMRRIPFHVIRMKPGMGVTFPGRTFHLFLAQSVNRIAVNFFFMPKFRKMEYSEHDWYTREAKYLLGNERLAFRQLWAKTFVRLYEETGKGVIYMGEKNEYI